MSKFLCGARKKNISFFLGGGMNKKRLSEIFRREYGNLFGGPPTETKFVKWSASRKRLRTADIACTYLRELFIIQPTRSIRSSSCLTLSRPPVTSHLTFSKRAISVTAPRLWNDLPPELRTFSLPPPSSLQIIKHHLHHA